jgi:Domain of unknown function (DUF4157)
MSGERLFCRDQELVEFDWRAAAREFAVEEDTARTYYEWALHAALYDVQMAKPIFRHYLQRLVEDHEFASPTPVPGRMTRVMDEAMRDKPWNLDALKLLPPGKFTQAETAGYERYPADDASTQAGVAQARPLALTRPPPTSSAGAHNEQGCTPPHVSPRVVSAIDGTRPTLQMLFGRRHTTSDPEHLHAAAARGIATAAEPLPHLAQIQRSFGKHNVSGVKAHLGADATASAREMGAQAFATGDHVVLGEGADLHTVAHEAAHVVQQRSGVALTGGVGQEGDAHERHADAVADAVVAGRSAEAQLSSYAESAGGVPTAGAVQRAEVPHRTADTALDAYAKAFSDMVDRAAKQVLQIDTVPEDGGGMYDRWSTLATDYLDSTIVSPFLHAAYGYAVEKMVTKDVHSIDGQLPSGWSVLSQVSRGMTRPDFVLWDGGGGERAWLDVTSDASTGHIFNKAGSGWKSRDYVFEIVYTALDLSKIVASGGMVAGIKARRKHEAVQKKETKAIQKLRADILKIKSKYNAVKLPDTMQAFTDYFKDYSFSHNMIRSLIELANLDLGDFGYKRAKALGRDLAVAMQFMYERYINNISLYA